MLLNCSRKLKNTNEPVGNETNADSSRYLLETEVCASDQQLSEPATDNQVKVI